MEEAEKYMRRAIELAKTATGYTSPNPLVGCVVVKDGQIISEACHERYGEFHAERNALTRCKEDMTGADLYVTLEPCCHFGKTPPCTDIIIEKGIKRVYVGSLDSNPLVAGKGIELLQAHGIEVHTGVLENECIKMNEIFFHYITHQTPFVAVKYAMTLDGKIAAYTGDSKWITSEKTRQHVHFLRKKYAAIMVGINTVLCDNPMLNCRMGENPPQPVRIILDSKLSIPTEGINIVDTARDIRTIIVYNLSNENEHLIRKKERLKEKGVEVIGIENTNDSIQNSMKYDVQNGKKENEIGNGLNDACHTVDIKMLMIKLGELGIDSVLIEGGGEVNAAAFQAGVVNKVYAYIAPKIIMGRSAKSPVTGDGIELMSDAIDLKEISYREMSDGDILVEGYVI